MSAFPGSARAAPVRVDAVQGDRTLLRIPAHVMALREMGEAFLTDAFRAFGSIDADNSVARIVSIKPCAGGSTGAKFFLDVEYQQPDSRLHISLFLKFSRDFDDVRRDDPGRYEMASEVPFTWLSREAGRPIAVPAPYFADYQYETGTGCVITERIAYGEGDIEPHRAKTLDHVMLDDPLGHYREVVRSLARLCGAHKSGRLSPRIDADFPFDPVAGSADLIAQDDAQFAAQLEQCFDFARPCPQLLPAEVRSAEFMAKMDRDAWYIRRNEAAIQRYLRGNSGLIALCHWNAHIDNCFFVRKPGRGLECGFIDWGRVGQITFGSALWGGLSAAHQDVWDFHLDELLELFAGEYRIAGGPAVSATELKRHLTLHIAAMGMARVLAFPEIVRFRLPQCTESSGPRDPMFGNVEPARNCLHVYTVFLKFWLRQDFGEAVSALMAQNN